MLRSLLFVGMIRTAENGTKYLGAALLSILGKNEGWNAGVKGLGISQSLLNLFVAVSL